MSRSVILIPSRLSATRLPWKPLLKINGVSIISHVYKKAKEADIGEVYVATEDKEILDEVNLNGGNAILTSNKHKTGSDRIFECYEKLDLKNIDYIINLQGDEPSIDINDLRHLNKLIEANKTEIGTLAAEIDDQSKVNNENIVKVITDSKITNENFTFAIDFANTEFIRTHWMPERTVLCNEFWKFGIQPWIPQIRQNLWQELQIGPLGTRAGVSGWREF